MGPSYYVHRSRGAKIIFIIDTSGSMNGLRIVAAKRELCRAIEELPANVEFNVIAFNSLIYPWQGKRRYAAATDSKQRRDLLRDGARLANRTASYDALEAALQFEMRSHYFLTDGAPGRRQNYAAAEINCRHHTAETSSDDDNQLTGHWRGTAPKSLRHVFCPRWRNKTLACYERVDN